MSALAWIGILGLFASGAFLEPNLEDPLTVIKMVGRARGRDERRRHDPPDGGTAPPAALACDSPPLPRAAALWCIWSALVSQAGWWTAVIIGMLNTAVR